MNTGVRSARPGTAREELRRNWRSVFSRGKSALYVSSLRTLTNTRTVAVSITGFDAIGYSEDQKMVSRGSDFTIVYNDLAPVSQPTLALLQTDMIGSSNRLILLAVPFGEPFKKRSMEEGICSITERQK
jgi:hypothetical protein